MDLSGQPQNARARELIRLASPIIRSAGRKCILMAPADGLSSWWADCAAAGIFTDGGGVVDGVAVHSYPGLGVSPWTLPPNGGPASLQVIDNVRASVPSNIPIYITERGIGTNPPYTGAAHKNVGTLQQQSDWVRDSYNAVYAVRSVAGKSDIKLIDWYLWQDRSGTGVWADVCGFYYNGGAVKTPPSPGITALARFAAQPARQAL
jgi:hypothetical protein